VFAKKIKKIRKTNKKTERREKIQNEHCPPGEQTTCSQKNLKKLEKQTKRAREEEKNTK